MPSAKQFTLRGLIFGAIIIAVAVAVVVPPFVRALRRIERGECRSALRSLWACHLNYTLQHGRRPDSPGADFFLALQPMVGRQEIFFCPETNDEIVPGRTSYRGPALPINSLRDEDPVGADKEGNHGPGEGGNILMKTGEVAFYEPTDALWIRARTTTRE